MKINIPWLSSRKIILFSAFTDAILITLILLNYFNSGTNSYYIPDLIFIIYIGSWIITSYISGRYTISNNSIKVTSIKLLFSTFLTAILSFIIFGLIYLKSFILLDNYNLLISSYILNFFSSYLLQLGIKTSTRKVSSNIPNWLLIGNKKTCEYLEKSLKWSRIDTSLSHVELDNTNNIDVRNKSGIILESINMINHEQYKKILDLKNNGLPVVSIIEWSEKFLQRDPPELINENHLLVSEFSSMKGSLELRLKRIGEIIISVLLLTLTTPILLLASILIKIEDGGPILYSQLRHGFGRKVFRIYKLRTMRIDAEKTGVQWAKESDKRITKIGRFLRSTRIDELPQLWSVIDGKMSLIGPRPERPEFDIYLEEKIPHYRLRYLMKPGLSGWAQVNYPYGASLEDATNKLSYDLFYIKHFSTFLDFLILLKTIRVVFSAKGASPITK